MEFKDLPVPFQDMAANIVRSQLATLDLSTVEKETIDNISHNVRNAFIKLYEEKLSSENKDYSLNSPHTRWVVRFIMKQWLKHYVCK